MKKVSLLMVLLVLLFGVAACGNKEAKTADYSTEQAEKALNDGEDITGKTVNVEVDNLVPDGTLGYTIWSGEHLNFVSSENPDVKKGDTMIVKVKEVTSTLGSYIITYDKQ